MRGLELAERLVEADLLWALLGALARLLDLGAEPQLHLARCFLGEGDRDDFAEPRAALSHHHHDALDQHGRLAGAGRRFDHEGRVEFVEQLRARGLIARNLHGMPRNVRRSFNSARMPLRVRTRRRSSSGPQSAR